MLRHNSYIALRTIDPQCYFGAAITDQADATPDLFTNRTLIDLIPLGMTMTYLPDFVATTVLVEIFLPILV